MKLWIAAFLLLIAIILVAQNTGIVTLRFLFWEAAMSRVVLLLITLVVGFLIGFVTAKLPKGRARE